MADPPTTHEMRDVVVFETHPAVCAALVRRFEAEPGVAVIQTFVEPDRFADAVEHLTPAFAVVGTFGPYGSHAANRAVDRSHRTRVVAVVPDVSIDQVGDMDDRVTIVEDGPHGDLTAKLITGAIPMRGTKDIQRKA